MKRIIGWICVTITCATLSACGNDGSGASGVSGGSADTYKFPAGKATLAFSAISTAQLPVSISGIDFTVNLPVGMSVDTASGGTGQIVSTTVTQGTALTGTNLAFGSYSASTRKVNLGMATTSNNYRAGEFLRLGCTIAPTASITLGDLRGINSPILIVKAVGYDPITSGTVQLTSKVKLTVSAQ